MAGRCPFLSLPPEIHLKIGECLVDNVDVRQHQVLRGLRSLLALQRSNRYFNDLLKFDLYMHGLRLRSEVVFTKDLAGFHLAARLGLCSAVKYFVELQGIHHASDHDGGDGSQSMKRWQVHRGVMSPLSLAAEHGHLNVVQTLLDGGAPVDEEYHTDDDSLESMTALKLAVRGNHRGVVAALLQAGADPNLPDLGERIGPLPVAARTANADMVRMLLAAGADAQRTDKHGRTALHYMVYGHDMRDMAEVLVSEDVDSEDHDCSRGGLVHRMFLKWFGVLHTLLEAAPQTVHWSCGFGNSVLRAYLRSAEYQRDVENEDDEARVRELQAETAHVVGALLQYRPDVNARDMHGETPLHVAIFNSARGTEKCIPLLVAAGADIAARDNRECTPLMVAAGFGTVESVRLMLEAGGDVLAQDEAGKTALHRAAEFNVPEIVHMLLHAGSRVDQADSTGQTPLHYAASSGRVECVRALLEAGADIDSRESRRRRTPLWFATRRRYSQERDDVVELLLASGADLTR